MTASIALPARLDLSTLPGALDPVCEAVRRRALALHASTPHTSVPHASVPHTSVPHTSVPHASVPHTSVPHDAVPHDAVPHTLAREKPLRHPDGPGAALPEVIVLDGSTLERFDSAALAALLVLQREAIAQGCRIRLEGMPKGLRTLASIYGLQDAFLDRQA